MYDIEAHRRSVLADNHLVPGTLDTVKDIRSKVSGLHFAKESLSTGEREILVLAESLLKVIDTYGLHT